MTNKIALVTGAGSGIGRAVSVALQAHGYTVVLAGRRLAQLEETASLGAPGTAGMVPIPCDLTVEADVKKLFDRIEHDFERRICSSTTRESTFQRFPLKT